MDEDFYSHIKDILAQAWHKVYYTANFVMVEAYWEIGKSIVEKQGGAERTEYGKALLKELAKQMRKDFGKGFTERELRKIRQFYLMFPIRDTLILIKTRKGFSLAARQKRITFDGRHFYIDLVLYNYILKCFVLIDLKTCELTHQDLGQMQMYVNYYTRELMNEGNNQIFASKYKLYLPSEEELRATMQQEIEKYELINVGGKKK